MKRAIIGVLAHVDAGKTTLCEGLLFRAGRLRSLGRVDHGDAFLDTEQEERRRGITIFSKQAILKHGDACITLLDTPGHVDFSAEMERTLSVLDCAVLVVSAADSVQGHAETLWRLLGQYQVPTFIFVNKMDTGEADRATLLTRLRQRFSEGCMMFDDAAQLKVQAEDIATLDEGAMNEYLEHGNLSEATLRLMISRRLIFPCYFGSALKLDGVDAFLDGLARYTAQSEYTSQPTHLRDFGARIYKISHDPQGNRLTWLKVTGGELAVKMMLTNARSASGASPRVVNTATSDASKSRIVERAAEESGIIKNNAAEVATAEIWQEKADQIRVYSGAKFTLADTAAAGTLCAVTGLTRTYPGQGLGVESDAGKPLLEPVLTYTLIPGGADVHKSLQALRTLEDEDPLLHVRWQERLQEVQLDLMGEVQLEIIQQLMHDRFGLDVGFGPGSIMYRETIEAPVEGIGHFEPLRHYAEVHLLLEPAPRGSGLRFASSCSQDVLDRNWQRLILTHLREREPLGVLTGSPIADMRITLLTGRGHLKHTEGGDFRQATYRAVRHGLMKAKSRQLCRLLEPWYRFRLELPHDLLGRAMSDIQRMGGNFGVPDSTGAYAVLEGEAPVSQMRDYAAQVNVYSHAQGSITRMFAGYRPCHNEAEVIEQIGYDPQTDIENTPDSVFCAHGAGYTVKWDRVEDFMHVESAYSGNMR
ncbi:MAG: TetM/TetW/TetO/TetS family tetracycline resistance ribosomal protection protein [Bifidobacterium sp.]|jgi:small GTP-binding protein|nr:TetM/TetW/TetO/TetS family tetracycline resistance ribosomal protection protein [Bifidobacterium sp.]